MSATRTNGRAVPAKPMGDLETTLARWLGASCSLTFGRASTGLYALFRSLAAKGPGGEVLIPELCCETIAPTAYYAGLTPVMVDVDPETLGPSVHAVAASISPRTRALLLIYVFGIPFDIRPFLAMGTEHDFLVIEDIAQGVGGEFDGEPLGSRGDAALLSFGPGKILHGGGGALVLRDGGPTASALPAIRAEIDARPQAGSFDRLALSFRNLTHGLAGLSRSDPRIDVSSAFRSLLPHYERVMVRPRTALDADSIISQIHRIEEDRGRRFARYLTYRDRLDGTGWRILDLPDTAMCWRVCLVAPDATTALDASARLLASGLPASNHYFPVGLLVDGTSGAVASDLGHRLLNLWVDESVTDEEIERTTELLVA